MKRILMSITAALAIAGLSSPLQSQTDTIFTYQGELMDGGAPANGTFNIDFTLWDNALAGIQIGSPVMFNGFTVADGRISVELDFGAAAFNNSNRWLEISVNGSELSPRQAITRAPYSIQTRGIFVDENNNVGIGTTAPGVTLHVEGPILSGGPNGGDIGARNPNNATAGVGLGWDNDIPRIRIGGEGAGTTGGFDIQTIGNRSLMRILDSGNVGIGTTTPFDATLDVLATDEIFAIKGVNYTAPGNGVVGHSTPTFGPGIGVLGISDSDFGYGVFSEGDFGGSGAKYFVQPHPKDPSREIRFVCLEGNESGTYFRGSARLDGGRAYIEVPEEFRLVSETKGLTVQLTARGPDAGLWIESVDLDQIVVMGYGDVEFDYFVNGVRRGFSDHQSITPNHAYVPDVRGVPFGTQYRLGQRQILVKNGILNPDFTPNEETAERMGWPLRDPNPSPNDPKVKSQ